MTSLQKQLAAIAATSTHQLDLKAQKLAHGKSLLFEPKIAASQSFDNIYLICYDGYQDLCALDSRFLKFSRTLFSEQSKAEDRTQMNQKENEKLDGVLETFITMVGPRLLLKPAEKALEWLVRRFRVHEYNTECLVLTYLPYHNTPQFLALLSILPPNPPPSLRFLHPYIQSPTNPPRRTLTYTAMNTPVFFDALQNYTAKVLQAGYQGPTLLAFWSGVTTQTVNEILAQNSARKEVKQQQTEELLVRLLRVLNTCMRASNGADAVTACYMIVIVLATKAALEDKVLDSIMEAVILSQSEETLDACLICLAIVAEERLQVQLPRAVSKKLLKIPNLSGTLLSVSTKCRVGRLALGCALDAVRTLTVSRASQQSFRELIEANLLDEPQASVAVSALLQSLTTTQHGLPQHSHFIDYVSQLSDTPSTARVLQSVATENSIDLESLGLTIGLPMRNGYANRVEDADEDEDMHYADQEQADDISALLPAEIPEASFLDASSMSFPAIIASFEKAVLLQGTRQFLDADSLQQKLAFKRPIFLSFLIRTWCSSSSVAARAAALRAVTFLIKDSDKPTDSQQLIPYVLVALTDSSSAVRRSAATCISTLATAIHRNGTTVFVSLYDKDVAKARLTRDQTSEFLSTVLVPVLEECTMDAQFIITHVKEVLEGTHSVKKTKDGLKAASRGPVLTFLIAHAALSPLLSVRVRLLPIFKFLGKMSASVRSNTLVPLLRDWCSKSNAEITGQCHSEGIESTEADRVHLAVLMPKEAESVTLVQDVITGSVNKERSQLLEVAFDWLVDNYASMRSEARLAVSQKLLDLALQESDSSLETLSRGRALETLRNIRLESTALTAFVESVSSPVHMPEGPPAKKRRRTSRNEMARADCRTPNDISRALRRLTLVLELIEGSNPGEHTALFGSLFSILGELQQLKQQSGSDLVYLQSLIFSSLTPMVNRLKEEEDTSEIQSCRPDLLIDCIRHSTSPQIQNAALLLIANLASWVPEMILHNLMPIFTFIGSSLLRQHDDYSAHVVDQTIARVIPQLASSLRSKHEKFLTGVADLLLSFTAAFEHIPQHRRLKLFSELARTLGPSDSLPAIIALLIDRYPNSKTQRRFTTDLLLVFDPPTALETFRGYLDLVEDAVKPRRTISETLFSLSDKAPIQVEQALHNLLSSVTDLASDDRLKTHVGKAFKRRIQRDAQATEATFATIVETIIRISKAVKQQPKLYQDCSGVLSRGLDLLPTAELIRSAELLLTRQDHEVQIAAIKSIEVRSSAVLQNDKTSVDALLTFLPTLDSLLRQSIEVDVKRILISCIDSIISRFGKRDTSAVATVAETVSGSHVLSSEDIQTRILSLLCLTSVIDVLEEEAISLLPIVLPVAFEYLRFAIEEENESLHNAVYALLSNGVERLGFMFSRDYLVPILKLSQRSAVANIDDSCDEERNQLNQRISSFLDAQEIFIAIQSTWTDALEQGSEAAREQLELMCSTIDSQSKAKLSKACSTLFSLLFQVFKLRDEAEGYNGYDDDDVQQLEGMLVMGVIAMVLKLNDATFRPFFVQLVDQAASSVTFYNFATAFFEKFKSIVTTYASYILDPAATLLNSLSKQVTDSPLRTAILDALRTSFTHDQDAFWQSPSHYVTILVPLLSQLTVPSPATTQSAIPAIAALAGATASTDAHREMNSILLKYMRSEDAHTRLATAQCERALTERLGEEWLVLLPEMLPFISEAREDDDESVEREVQRWITEMEGVLGEDLEPMLQ